MTFGLLLNPRDRPHGFHCIGRYPSVTMTPPPFTWKIKSSSALQSAGWLFIYFPSPLYQDGHVYSHVWKIKMYEAYQGFSTPLRHHDTFETVKWCWPFCQYIRSIDPFTVTRSVTWASGRASGFDTRCLSRHNHVQTHKLKGLFVLTLFSYSYSRMCGLWALLPGIALRDRISVWSQMFLWQVAEVFASLRHDGLRKTVRCLRLLAGM